MLPIDFTETTIKKNRFEHLVSEWRELYNSWKYSDAKNILDVYISNVLYPHDSTTIELYSHILSKLYKDTLASIYMRYFQLYKDNYPKDLIKEFLDIPLVKSNSIDDNLLSWKYDLLLKYYGNIPKELTFNDSDNHLFLQLLYLIEYEGNIELEDDTVNRIKESKHRFKPLIIYLYLEYRVSKKSSLTEYQVLLLDILNYEDEKIYSQSYYSTYSYGYHNLWIIERDECKKFIYFCKAIKYSLSAGEPVNLVSDKVSYIKNIIIDILLDWKGWFLYDYTSFIEEYISKDWKEIVERFNRQWDDITSKDISWIIRKYSIVINTQWVDKSKVHKMYQIYIDNISSLKKSDYKKFLRFKKKNKVQLGLHHIQVHIPIYDKWISLVVSNIHSIWVNISTMMKQIPKRKNTTILFLSLVIFFCLFSFILFVITHRV